MRTRVRRRARTDRALGSVKVVQPASFAAVRTALRNHGTPVRCRRPGNAVHSFKAESTLISALNSVGALTHCKPLGCYVRGQINKTYHMPPGLVTRPKPPPPSPSAPPPPPPVARRYRFRTAREEAKQAAEVKALDDEAAEEEDSYISAVTVRGSARGTGVGVGTEGLPRSSGAAPCRTSPFDVAVWSRGAVLQAVRCCCSQPTNLQPTTDVSSCAARAIMPNVQTNLTLTLHVGRFVYV